MYFVDMHCHCLPGLDDGAHTMEESIKMLKTAYEDGIRTVIATPHFHHRRGNASKNEILESVVRVQEEIQKSCPDMKIFAGNEIYYSSSVPERISKGELCTLADSKYVLIEFSPEKEYSEMRRAVNAVQAEGVWPVIAHVERYECLVKNPALASELAEMGAYLQVNAAGILGKYGRKEKRMIKKLFSAGDITFVATDAHDTVHRRQELSEAAAYVRKKYGEAVEEACFSKNAQMVVKNIII